MAFTVIKKPMTKLGKYLKGILLWLDTGLNTLVIGFIGMFIDIPAPAEGNPHFTVSEVTAELRERGYLIGCIGCKLLNWMFRPWHWNDKRYDHCKNAMKGMPESVDENG